MQDAFDKVKRIAKKVKKICGTISGFFTLFIKRDCGPPLPSLNVQKSK